MWHEQFRSCESRARRGWAGFDADFNAFFGGHGPKRRGPFGGGRMFEQGDLKLVILRLLDEKAATRLRHYQGIGGSVGRTVYTQRGRDLSHADHAGRPGIRRRHAGRGWQEGVRHY